MQLSGKLILGTLAGISLISGDAIQNPRAAYAAVATNIRDQDNPARHPFTTSCENSSPDHFTSCSTAAVPAGEEVVIETISYSVRVDPNTSRPSPR